jgi:hypothetical protein
MVTLPRLSAGTKTEFGLPMPLELDSTTWLLALVQLAGFLTAVTARLHQGRAGQNFWHRVFLLSLAVSGATTLVALLICPCSGTICGAIFSLSVVTAVCEVRGPTPVTHAS